MTQSLRSMARSLRSLWAPLLQFGAWIGGVVGAFIANPPELWWDAPNGGVTSLARFLILMICGVALIACWKWRRPAHLRGWIAAAIITGVFLGVGSLFVYNALYDSWTCWLRGDTYLVVGAEYLPDAAAAIVRTGKAHASCSDIIQSVNGLTYQLWPRDQILHRYLQLAGLFIASTAFITTGVIALLQALRCAGFSR